MQSNEMINEEKSEKKVWTADELRALGYDEEDVALMLDEKLWAEIEATKDEECVTWYPGMYTESTSKKLATKKLRKPLRKSAKRSAKRLAN